MPTLRSWAGLDEVVWLGAESQPGSGGLWANLLQPLRPASPVQTPPSLPRLLCSGEVIEGCCELKRLVGVQDLVWGLENVHSEWN